MDACPLVWIAVPLARLNQTKKRVMASKVEIDDQFQAAVAVRSITETDHSHHIQMEPTAYHGPKLRRCSYEYRTVSPATLFPRRPGFFIRYSF